NHDAIADDGLNSGPEYPAWNQLEYELLLADEYRVSRVVPALVARDEVEFLGEQVDHLPFALVTPLRAQYNDVFHWKTKTTHCNAGHTSIPVLRLLFYADVRDFPEHGRRVICGAP